MKIALVRPNYYTHLITPHIGLGYLSSYLRKKGFQVKIIDALNLDLSLREVLRGCSDADLVGINVLSDYFQEAVELSLALKKQNKTVVLGGPHVSALPVLSLQTSQADFAVIGEGEETLMELAFAKKNSLEDCSIPGLISIKNERFIKRDLVPDLDEFPFPDWEQMDPRSFKKAPHGGVIKKFPVAPITSTRGCPFECTFCASPQLWEKKIRFRSSKNVVDEIEYLIKDFGVREIHFEDDNFTLKKSHVISVCEEILRRNLRIFWATPNGIRADKIDHQLLSLMKRSGCYAVAFGIESANEHILKNIKKDTDLETITKAIEMAHKVGMITQGFFIFGLPGETEESIYKTIKYARHSRLDKAQFLLLDVLPGSALWSILGGKFELDWKRRSYQQVSWIPEGISKDFLQNAPSKAFRSFFLRPKRIFTIARLIKPFQLRYILRRIFDFGIVSKKLGVEIE